MIEASIIIVSYNSGHFLSNCLDALGMEMGTESEVIIVDNGSTDGNLGHLGDLWPWVRLMQNRQNCGFAAACNQAARQSQGQYLVFLNPDTLVQPGWLAGLLKPLKDKGKANLVTSKLQIMDQADRIQMCGQDTHYTGLSFGRGLLEPASYHQAPAKVSAVSGASFAIPKTLWEKLLGFDDLFFMYYEETDLSWRACLQGYTCMYVPDSVALHNHSSKPSLTSFTFSFRNRYIMLLKNWKLFTLVGMLPALIIAEVIEWIYAGIQMGLKGWQAKLSAWGWIMAHTKEVWGARRSVQAARSCPDWVLLESCCPALNPRQFSGGRLGRFLIKITNAILIADYWLLLNIARSLDL
jgi:hypothetical protein